jgi:hypothetical protein
MSSSAPAGRLVAGRCRVRLLLAALAGIGAAACSSNGPTDAPPEPVSHPAFTISSPARAAMLQTGGVAPASVTITGEACDSLYPITSLTLDGESIPVPGNRLCEPFSVTRESRWGLTIVSGEAQNSHGTVTRLAQSFLRSADYYTPASPGVPHGIAVQMNSMMISQITQLLQSAAAGFDWNSNFSLTQASPDANGDGYIDTQSYTCGVPPLAYTQTNRKTGYEIRKTGALTVQTGAVTLTVVPGVGLRASMTVPAIHVPVFVRGAVNLECLGEVDAAPSGTIDATGLTLAATFGLNADSISYSSTVQDVSVSWDNIAVNVDLSGPAFISSVVSNVLTGVATGTHGSLVTLVASMIGPTLAGLLDDFIGAPRLPDVLGLQVVAVPDAVAFPAGAIRTALSVQVLPGTVRAGPAPARGSLRRNGADPTVAGPTVDLGVDIKDDFVNQALWAAWAHGLFDLGSLSALGCDASVPGGAVSFSSFAELPPVLMPGTGDSIAVGLGDMRLTGTVDRGAVGQSGAPLNVVLYASGIATGKLDLSASNKMTVDFAPAPEVAVEIAAIDDSSALEPLHAALEPFFGCLVERMTQTALGGIAAPEVDFSTIPGVPAGTVWRLDHPAIGREGNFTTLRGAVTTGP